MTREWITLPSFEMFADNCAVVLQPCDTRVMEKWLFIKGSVFTTLYNNRYFRKTGGGVWGMRYNQATTVLFYHIAGTVLYSKLYSLVDCQVERHKHKCTFMRLIRCRSTYYFVNFNEYVNSLV